MELKVGMEIESFCEGSFGRDGYGPHVVVAWGWNWLLVRVNNKYLDVAEFDSNQEMMESIQRWMKEEEQY
jgi:hypothetical protein